MEKFNLEKFNTGDYDVVTRDGHSARIVCTDKIDEYYHIIALILKEYDDGKSIEELISVTNEGKYYLDDEESIYDIFLVKKKWSPKKGEKYWHVGVRGEVFRVEHFDSEFDNEMLNFGNCFHSKEEAEAMVDKIRQVLNS